MVVSLRAHLACGCLPRSYFLDSDKVNAQYTPEFLAQRRADLEKWMQRLHKIPCVACFPVFLSFLEADKTESLKTFSNGLVPVLKGVGPDGHFSLPQSFSHTKMVSRSGAGDPGRGDPGAGEVAHGEPALEAHLPPALGKIPDSRTPPCTSRLVVLD